MNDKDTIAYLETDVTILAAQLQRAKSERDELAGLLREWQHIYLYNEYGQRQCPFCKTIAESGDDLRHTPECLMVRTPSILKAQKDTAHD